MEWKLNEKTLTANRTYQELAILSLQTSFRCISRIQQNNHQESISTLCDDFPRKKKKNSFPRSIAVNAGMAMGIDWLGIMGLYPRR